MSAQLQRSVMLAALVEAGPDGVLESEMPPLGGMWWRDRLSEISRSHTLGWEMVDGEKRYVLANGVEQADGDGAVDPSPTGEAVSPLNTESETLFDPPSRSAYEIDREAA